MQITINNGLYRIDFHHERDWIAPDRVRVHGRTQCVVTAIKREPTCPRHGSTAPQAAPPDARCSCLKTTVGEGFAYCSIRDHYTPQDGRKLALRRALTAMPRAVRGLFWKEFLQQVPQRVRVPAHEELRKVMAS